MRIHLSTLALLAGILVIGLAVVPAVPACEPNDPTCGEYFPKDLNGKASGLA